MMLNYRRHSLVPCRRMTTLHGSFRTKGNRLLQYAPTRKTRATRSTAGDRSDKLTAAIVSRW
eukprot:6920215-Pyramimonas_sp.AAC.1